MLTHQQRITIVAQEICLRRVEPQLWQKALVLAEQDGCTVERMYTRLRCRQIELLVPVSPSKEAMLAYDQDVVGSLRLRSQQWLWDMGLLVGGVNCAGILCWYFWGGI